MNEREIALEKVTEALPVFEKIDELYYAANSLKQRSMVARTDEERFRQNTKRAFKWGFGYIGVLQTKVNS